VTVKNKPNFICNIKNCCIPIIRASDVIESVLYTIEQYLVNTYDPQQPIVVGIGGRLGVGKSMLRRTLMSAITRKFSWRLRELESVVIPVRLDDMVKPWEDRIQNNTFTDKVDVAMVYNLERAIVEGKIVQKYMLAYNDISWRLEIDSSKIDTILSSGASIIEEQGRILLYSDAHTREYQARGTISPVSKIYIDITEPRERYFTIERFNPRGHVVVLEGVSVAFNEKAAEKYATLLYVFADDITRRENIMLRATSRYRRNGFALSEILDKSERDDLSQRHIDNRTRGHCAMIVDSSRPLCENSKILMLIKKKMSILKRQYQAGVVPATLYTILEKHITAHMSWYQDKIKALPVVKTNVSFV